MITIHSDIDINNIPANIIALATAFDNIKVKVTIGIVNYVSDIESGYSVNVGVYHDKLIQVIDGVTQVVGDYDTCLFAFHFNHDGSRVEYENDSGSIYRDDDRIHEGWTE